MIDLGRGHSAASNSRSLAQAIGRLLLCGCATLALTSVPAIAQTAPAGDDSARSSGDDIIVTARKREESILNVPVVMTVLGDAQLEQSGTQDLYRLKTFVPSLLLGQSTNSVGIQVSLRGVGTTAQNATMDQSVSLNLDGLPLSQGVAYTAGMFDVGHVEVLKGPQALFYGKNSPGGVISMRSNDPTSHTEIIGRFGYETVAHEKSAEIIVSGPISDSLKVRLGGRWSASDGYFRNTAVAVPGFGSRSPSSPYIPSQSLMLRGTVLFEPGSGYKARLKLNYTRDHQSNAVSPLMPVYCPDGTGPVAPLNRPYLSGSTCTIGRDYKLALPDPAAFPGGLPNNGNYFSLSKQYFGTLDQTVDLTKDLSVNAVTGYYRNDWNGLMHGSSTSGIAPFVQNYIFSNRQFTQEVRLTSDFKDSPVNFMLGMFYQSAKMTNTAQIEGNATIGLPAFIQYVTHRVTVDSISGFGQVIWNVSPQIELAGGGRYTSETRNHVETNLNPLNGPVGNVDRPDPKIHASNFSPEVSLTYKPTSELTFFASYKQGFKSGSFNSINFVPSNTLASFADEKVEGFEGGIKTQLLDRQLSFNLAAYDYKYSNLQVGALILSQAPGGAFVFQQRTLNAATARVKGIEADFNLQPRAMPGFSLRGALAYNHARYSSFPNAPCGNGQTIAQGCNQLFNATLNRYGAQDLTGRSLVRAPDWSATFGATYELPVSSKMAVRMGADMNYTSSYSTTLVDLPGFAQTSFAKLNLNIALKDKDDRWELALIGTNITDKLTRGLCFNSNVQNGTIGGGQISGQAAPGLAGDDEAVCAIDPGRQVLIRLTVRPQGLF